VTLGEDTVQLPNDAVIPDYFVFEYPNWVMVLGVTTDQKLVLIRQYRHGIGAAHYELAAGVADEGSTLLDNAQREFLEETGYGGGEWQLWLKASANPATHTNTGYIFLATGVYKQGHQDLEHTEDIEVHLFDADEIRHLLETHQVFQSLHVAALWKYLATHPTS
jgi:8-oxo-dGTP pyrophosphatase MutT (NUDIX family)